MFEAEEWVGMEDRRGWREWSRGWGLRMKGKLLDNVRGEKG